MLFQNQDMVFQIVMITDKSENRASVGIAVHTLDY